MLEPAGCVAGVGSAVHLQDHRERSFATGLVPKLLSQFIDEASFAFVTGGDSDIREELTAEGRERHGQKLDPTLSLWQGHANNEFRPIPGAEGGRARRRNFA
jgi:hypothetical protein